MKICIKAHVSELFGPVPRGSLWESDHEVVADNPVCFRAVKGDPPLPDDDDDEEDG